MKTNLNEAVKLASRGQAVRREIRSEQATLARVRIALAAAATPAERSEIMRRHLGMPASTN